MKKVMFVMLLTMAGAVNAEPLTAVIHFVASHGTAAYAVMNSELRECDKKPNVLARHKGETGYNFEVTQCELDSNSNIEPVK